MAVSVYHCFHWLSEGLEKCCICDQVKPEDEAQDFNCPGYAQLQLWEDGSDCD